MVGKESKYRLLRLFRRATSPAFRGDSMLRSPGRFPPLARVLLVVVILATGVCGPAQATPPETAEPWVAGAFVADPAAVAAAAGLAPGRQPSGPADVEMLWRQDDFSFDDDGHLTHRRRWVYRILTVAGLEAWSVSEVAYSPWHQERPTVRARVVDLDGAERWIDPKRSRELTAEEAGLSGERRLVLSSLPVAVGAVIEEEVIRRDTQPYFAAGVSAKHLLVMPVPILRGRLTLTAPADLPLRFAVRRMAEMEPRREVVNGRVQVVFDYGAMPAAQPIEAGLPPDEPRYPQVVFATGASWSQVADAYGRMIDDQIAASQPAAVLGWLPSLGAEAQIDRIAELLVGVRGNVRYQRADLGATSVVPSAPLATLKRGAGDAKDLATLLAAALRAEGIPAYIALARAGFGVDIDPDLPGLGRFNHALVYVPAREPVWLDPGDRLSRVGDLSSDLQGRQALVISSNTRQLIRTPTALSSDNRTETTIEIVMADEGPSRVVETSLHHGAADRRQRLVTAQVSAEDRRLGYEAYVKAAYRAEALGEVEETEVEDLTVPFRLRLEAKRAGRAWTAATEGAVGIDLSYLITALPRELLVATSVARRGDFVFHEPFIAEWRYRIQSPSGMRLRELPASFQRPLGTGELSRKFRRRGAMVHVDVRLNSGPRRITAEQFRGFRAAVQELLKEEALVLWFDR